MTDWCEHRKATQGDALLALGMVLVLFGALFAGFGWVFSKTAPRPATPATCRAAVEIQGLQGGCIACLDSTGN